MTQKQLQQLLQQPYTTENWKQLLQYVFKNVQLLEDPPQIPINDDRVKSFKQYGSVKLSDGKILALFELNLHDNVNLIRNRVGLNDIVSRYIDQETTHGVLSIFEQGTEDYRFTFTAHSTEFDEEEQDFIERKTDTKRFTYILGKNESCRTAAQRFDELSVHKDTADITAVERAFSVEKLSKLFFKEYTEQFDKLVEYIKSKPGYFQAVFEKEESAARNFVKIFLGRLVFIKFVEKKGWLGVPPEETGWKNGNYKFLQQEYNKYEHKDQFLSRFLNPLFFEALNTGARDNDIFPLTGTKIPHLSGGLFENESPKTLRIDFPENLLTDLFDFFDRYNFTIDENDIHDKEVGIDPEMLGHIFENLLEDNKDKGAFYTPKEIVRYMCQESLKEYLKTYLQKESIWPSEDDKKKELEEILSRFIEKKEVSRILHLDKPLAQALKDVKICDPAIGSGAFPMGLLNEIFRLVKILHDESPDRVGAVWGMLGDKWEANTVKLNIIQNSIYGVDIEPGAVDIARLRFWLSLIIEEEIPQPLPHLNYKIVVGNSLLSKLDDTIIEIDWELKPENSQTNIFGNPHAERTRELLEEITQLQKTVFEPNSNEHELSIQIRNKKIDLLISQLHLMVDTKGLKEKPTGSNRTAKKQTELWIQTQGWKKQIVKLEHLKKQPNEQLNFFDWNLDFPEVMNEKLNSSTGFDIVIGNPPYGVSIKGQERQEIVNIWGKVPDYEIYYYFMELAYRLTKDGGIKSFITPNTYLFNTFATDYRLHLSNQWDMLEILDCTKFEIFNTATVRNTISLWKKGDGDLIGFRSTQNPKSFQELIKEKRLTATKNSLSEFQQNWALLFRLETHVADLVSKIRDHHTELQTYFPEISQGLIAYDKYQGQSAKIIKERAYHFEKYKEGLKKWLKGADVNEFDIQWNGNHYIDYCEGLANPRDPKFFEGRRILIREITNPKIFAAITEEELYNDPSIIIVKDNTSYSIKVLLAILNSSLLTFYHFNFSPKSTKGAFPKILVKDVKEFPIPQIKNKNVQQKIEEIVDHLNNKENEDICYEKMKQELDIYIFKLYDLNFEEAQIIEPNLSEIMTEVEYKEIEFKETSMK